MEYLTNLWKSDLFIPHGHCYLWKTELVGLHLISDLTIAIAYFSISLTLFYFVEKREDLPFNWIFSLFGAFIILCGTTHLLEVWTLWHPVYWLSGTAKALTAIISVYTAIVLVKLIPQALLIPSPSQLAAANQALEQQICDRELVEAQLQQVNNELQAQLAAEYRKLFESIDQGFCIVEPIFDAEEKPVDYRFLQVNPAFVRLTGLPVSAIGKTIRELIPDIEQFWIEAYGNVVLTGEPVRFENKSDALNRWFDVYASKLGDVTSRRVAILFTNITDRKIAEQISQRAAKLDAFRVTLADALRPIADPVEIQATANRVLGEYLGANRVAYFEIRGTDYLVERDYVNGATSMSGRYPLDSFSAKTLAEHRAGRSVSVSDVNADPYLPSEQKAAYAAIQVCAHIDVPLVKDGEFIAGLAVHMSEPRAWTPDEVTLVEEVAERTWAAIERARAEAIVAANLQDTRLLRDLSARLVTEDDTQTLYREILATAIVLTGADAGTVRILDARSQDFVLISSQGFDLQMTEHFYRVNTNSHTSCGIAMRNGERAAIDFDVPAAEDPDGSMRLHFEAGYRSAQSTPLRSRTGKPLGMVSTHWRSRHRLSDRELRSLDLLARQAADLIEQQQTTAALAERNQELDSFVHVVSHDLKAPLRAISNLSVWIEEDLGTALPAESQQQMAQLRSRVQRMEAMINGLLEYARVGRTDTQLQLVSVAELLTEILDSLAPPSTFKIVIAPELPTLHTKRLLLSQVFANLIGNAFKHHDKSNGFIQIACQEQSDFYEFTIVDDGPGIPPEQHDEVFIIFQSINPQKNLDSTGIGLSIVKKIVEAAGGQIRLKSELGKGTTFYFTWPKVMY
jgi:GAF domain-containing protein